MICLIAVLLQTLPTPFVLNQALVIGGVSAAGRRPVPEDAVVEEIVAGTWRAPKAGESVTFRGREHKWVAVSANKDGLFEGPAFGNGYAFVEVEEPVDSTLILNAQGDSLVYVNGTPRAGDPYSTGDLNLPVQLHAGKNELLFVVGRGRLKATLTSAAKPILLQASDMTLPDILATDHSPLWASAIVINSEIGSLRGLSLTAALPGGAKETRAIPVVPGMSVRKCPFLIPVPPEGKPGDLAVRLELKRGEEVLDSQTVSITVRKPSETHKRTFVSGIDGSVQYYAVNPAQKPASSNALVLTLHGASVEAIGQARAYASKDDVTLVAPTNRRPYGFDWEDIGREDALEVLGTAKKQIPHDPLKVDLVGHSMGGHGTWAIGTLYPNLFASIAPSAGWLSFWSYAGGWNPEHGLGTERLLRDSLDVSDTLGRVRNTLAEAVYILHGDADDNVPVTEARAGRAALEKIGHPRLEYHEQPGAGHWWGNQCVDWPPIFEMISRARLDPDPSTIDFTTQNPAVSGEMAWLTVDQQVAPLKPSHVLATRSADRSRVDVKAENVQRFTLRGLKPGETVVVNGRSSIAEGDTRAFDVTGAPANALSGTDKSARRSGPFKMVLARKFLLVVGTSGSLEENQWAANRARFDAETMLYRGNGAVDVIADKDYRAGRFRGRNVVLYGNADTNRAWKSLLSRCPVQVRNGEVTVVGSSTRSGSVGALLVYPNPNDKVSLVAAIAGTGLSGMRSTDRLPIFTSGVGYPDWILLEPSAPAGILADGFFSNDWKKLVEAVGAVSTPTTRLTDSLGQYHP